VYQRDAGEDVAVVGAATPVVVLGPRLTANQVSPGAARALVARAVELTRPEHVAFTGIPLADATHLLASVARLFGSPTLRDAAHNLVDDEDLQRARDEMVKAALSLKIRGRLEQLLQGLPPTGLDVGAYVAACQRTADRSAFLVGGDPTTIVADCAARGEGVRHLIALVAHAHFFPARHKLGLAR
ncbi:MAG TPA: hypothetical protein VK427_18885, partial [Kofleriaceae bacterium]|nr:hypothetical protein [Kofleriaceae bacterium]